MSIFDRIRRWRNYALVKRRRIEQILMDSTWVVRGGVFLVEYDEKFYILINKRDLLYAIAGFGEDEQMTLQESIFGIPVQEDSYKALRVMCGVFHVIYDKDILSRRDNLLSSPP